VSGAAAMTSTASGEWSNDGWRCRGV